MQSAVKLDELNDQCDCVRTVSAVFKQNRARGERKHDDPNDTRRAGARWTGRSASHELRANDARLAAVLVVRGEAFGGARTLGLAGRRGGSDRMDGDLR